MKRTIAIILTVLLTLGLFAGCAGSGEDKTIVVGASPSPHAELLNAVKDTLAEQGYTLEVKEYNDYILPNTATEDGELDANFFQHTPYLEDFNAENGTHLVSVGKVHYEPFGIYAGTASSIEAVADGAKIAVPNDTTNEARALQLLAAQGLITLKDGAGLTATKNDIVNNPKNVDIVEMEAALIPDTLDSVALGVINGNYAIGAGLKVSDAIALEAASSEAAQTYANVLVVKEGHENDAGIQALLAALQSDATRAYIEENYGGAVVAIS